MGLTLSKIGRHIKQKVFWERRVTARLHLPVWTPPYAGQCTFCTMCTSGAHHTPASSLPPCAPAPPMLQPPSPSCAARHQKTLHLGRPRLETERGMRGESSQQQQQFCHTGSAAQQQQQQHCTSSRREGWLVGGVPRRASRESETL